MHKNIRLSVVFVFLHLFQLHRLPWNVCSDIQGDDLTSIWSRVWTPGWSLHSEFWVGVQIYVASKFVPVPLAYWIVPLIVRMKVLQVFIGIELSISWARPVQYINSVNVFLLSGLPDHTWTDKSRCSDSKTSLIWSLWHVTIQKHMYTIKWADLRSAASF